MKKTWPLWTSIGLYAGVFALQLFQISQLTHGRQLYPLDDVYIHAAVAKNLLLHHVYGVTSYRSSFPSSSILWPFILALGFALVGVKAWVPLALNFLFSILCLWFADHLLKVLASSISPRLRFACLLLLVLGVPLVGLSFEGMEHVLQVIAILLLLYCYDRWRAYRTRGAGALLALSAAFAVGVRYESLFIVLLITLLLAWRREWALAIVVGGCSLIPVFAFGAFSLLHGSTFLPSPLLLKTSSSMQTSAFTAVRNLFSPYAVLSGISACFVCSAAWLFYFLRRRGRQTSSLPDLLLILVGTFVLHAQLAQFGWLFRYEAYLLATTVVLVGAALADPGIPRLGPWLASWMRSRWWKAGFIAVLAVAFGGRGASMLRGVPKNARAIYEQQYQTARFLAAFYPGQVVGLNDIGAPDFFADIRCVDLYGLASSDVANLRRKGEFTSQAVADLADRHGIRIAALYPGLFAGLIPGSWIPVSTLVVRDLPGKVQLGERRVTLYATNRAEADELSRHLQQFRSQLPSGVQVTAPNMAEPTEAKANPPKRSVASQGGKLVAWFRAGLDGLNSDLRTRP